MKIKLYQVDAFAAKVFSGNPAGVCPLDSWLPDHLMQSIAFENNLPETAFFVRKGDVFEIRWFTPRAEVDLCGHASLASGHVLFNHMGYDRKTIHFTSKSGELLLSKVGDLISMDFPIADFKKTGSSSLLTEALGKEPLEVYGGTKMMALFGSEKDILEIRPDLEKLKKLDAEGVIITAKGEIVDFVSRFFAPKIGIDEDPVTGSAHTFLIPLWAIKYGKNTLTALQLSERKGELLCKLSGKRVIISGKAVTYLSGEIEI